jgi:hypothetical protein
MTGLPHGQFKARVERETCLSYRMAMKYMRAAKLASQGNFASERRNVTPVPQPDPVEVVTSCPARARPVRHPVASRRETPFALSHLGHCTVNF